MTKVDRLLYEPYYDERLGRIFTPEYPENVTFFREDFRATELGQRLKSEGLDHSDNLILILGTAQTELDKEDVNITEMVAVARRLYLTGELKKKKAVVPAPPVPRPLSSSQLAWQEYRQFSERSTSAECTARAKVDSGYANFMQKNYERELNETPVPDAVVATGTQAVRTDKTIKFTQELNDHAIAYRRMSAADVRKNMNASTNPNHEKFRKLTDDAIAIGLI